MFIFKSKYMVGQQVFIDGGDMHGVITSITFASNVDFHYTVEYWANGALYATKVNEWRLSLKAVF